MGKTIAEYSADPSNPWHAWCVDHLTAAEHSFVRLAVKLNRLIPEHRMSLALMEGYLDAERAKTGLDRDAAYDAWTAYELFKADLTDYRLSKLAA